MMTPNYPNRYAFAHLPTPLEQLTRLSQKLDGPDIWIKRDDLTGLAGGGNKTRKLEFLLADALAHGCDHLITMGAVQSNHCRQTAAAAARAGLGCSLILCGTAPSEVTGNLLLDQLLGAKIYWAGERKMADVAREVTDQMRVIGRKPYLIPYGGSNVMGATSYVWAMHELMEQLQTQRLNVDFLVLASSSGGTQAGIALGATVYGFRGKVLGISVDESAETLQTKIASLVTATSTHLGLGMIPIADRITVNDDYIEPGYAVMTEVEKEAIQLVAQNEGILLDPVYTGRAMGGLIDLIRWGAFTRRQTVLFWHTGGFPSLFAYNKRLQN